MENYRDLLNNLNKFYQNRKMPPKKERVEPKVDLPEGDGTAGRAIFDQHCAACHALEGDDKTASAPTLGYWNLSYIFSGIIGRSAGST